MSKLLNSLVGIILVLVVSSSFAVGSKHDLCAKLATKARGAAANAQHAVTLTTYLKEQGEYNKIQSAHAKHKCSGQLAAFPEFTGSQHKLPAPEHSTN